MQGGSQGPNWQGDQQRGWQGDQRGWMGQNGMQNENFNGQQGSYGQQQGGWQQGGWQQDGYGGWQQDAYGGRQQDGYGGRPPVRYDGVGYDGRPRARYERSPRYEAYSTNDPSLLIATSIAIMMTATYFFNLDLDVR